MSTEFPLLVYKGNGPHVRKNGTYDYECVNDQEALDDKLSYGWFISLPEAIEANDTSAPSRKDTEARARNVGVEFTRNTSKP